MYESKLLSSILNAAKQKVYAAPQQAQQLATEACNLAFASKNFETLKIAMIAHFYASINIGDYTKAYNLFTTYHKVIDLKPPTQVNCILLSKIGMVHYGLFDISKAIFYMNCAKKVAYNNNYPLLLASIYNDLGNALMMVPDIKLSIEHFKDAIEICKKNDLKNVELSSKLNLSYLYSYFGNAKQTFDLLNENYEDIEVSQRNAMQMFGLMHKATVNIKHNKFNEAKFQVAEVLNQSKGRYTSLTATCYKSLAQIGNALNWDAETCLNYSEKAIDTIKQANNTSIVYYDSLKLKVQSLSRLQRFSDVEKICYQFHETEYEDLRSLRKFEILQTASSTLKMGGNKKLHRENLQLLGLSFHKNYEIKRQCLVANPVIEEEQVLA